MKYGLNLFLCLCLAAPGLAVAQNANDAVEPNVAGAGVIDLLEGGTLEAWCGPSEHWGLEEDCIVGDTGGEKIKIPEWIYTKRQFGDFVFTCEMKLTGDKSRNTGIYYRVQPFQFEDKRGKTTFEAPSGYEFDAAYHRPGRRNFRGSLGDWYARPSLRVLADSNLINEVYKEDDWNRMTIRARGTRLEYWINGTKIMDFVDSDPKASREGTIGFQIHNGSVMRVEYRNIRVLSL
ncbi:DUF1080 domain-containing protein [Pontiellaceae bacterium B12219]|nr:DUF1080 domain-containing protein [Pontiellaceae bacterium B12219]